MGWATEGLDSASDSTACMGGAHVAADIITYSGQQALGSANNSNKGILQQPLIWSLHQSCKT